MNLIVELQLATYWFPYCARLRLPFLSRGLCVDVVSLVSVFGSLVSVVVSLVSGIVSAVSVVFFLGFWYGFRCFCVFLLRTLVLGQDLRHTVVTCASISSQYLLHQLIERLKQDVTKYHRTAATIAEYH